MANEESKNKNDWASSVKWIVIGVITLTVVFLFKKEISQLLGRADTIEISDKGLKIKTVQTVLGNAEVSNVTVKNTAIAGDGIQDTSFISRRHMFQISWPHSGNWIANTTMSKALMQQMGFPSTVDMPLIIMKNEVSGNFRPNVNVVVESIGTMTTTEYMNRSVQILQQQGWRILTKDIDEDTHGGFISFFNNNLGYTLFQFQRYAIANGKAYIITASQLPPQDSFSQSLRQELLSILNSFRVIT